MVDGLIIRKYTNRLIALRVNIMVIRYFIVKVIIFVMIIHLMAKPRRGGIPASMIITRKRTSFGIEEDFVLLISFVSLVLNGLILKIRMFQ